MRVFKRGTNIFYSYLQKWKCKIIGSKWKITYLTHATIFWIVLNNHPPMRVTKEAMTPLSFSRICAIIALSARIYYSQSPNRGRTRQWTFRRQSRNHNGILTKYGAAFRTIIMMARLRELTLFAMRKLLASADAPEPSTRGNNLCLYESVEKYNNCMTVSYYCALIGTVVNHLFITRQLSSSWSLGSGLFRDGSFHSDCNQSQP